VRRLVSLGADLLHRAFRPGAHRLGEKFVAALATPPGTPRAAHFTFTRVADRSPGGWVGSATRRYDEPAEEGRQGQIGAGRCPRWRGAGYRRWIPAGRSGTQSDHTRTVPLQQSVPQRHNPCWPVDGLGWGRAQATRLFALRKQTMHQKEISEKENQERVRGHTMCSLQGCPIWPATPCHRLPPEPGRLRGCSHRITIAYHHSFGCKARAVLATPRCAD
jgi:hypothetical protein